MPLGRQALHHGARHHDLSGLGLAGHAIGGMDGRSENIAVLEHHGAEMSADADRDRLTFDLQFGMRADIMLHAARSIERVVRRGERRHDLIADRLDHGAMVLLGGGPHDFHAGQHHVARAQISHDFVDPRAADDVSKQNGQFDVFSHDLFRA